VKPDQAAALRHFWRQAPLFARIGGRLNLRSYQAEAARQVAASVLEGRGLSFVIMFPRQSGKNELQAQLEAYLLLLLSDWPYEMVKVSPTWKPQSQNAMRRLERVLDGNLFTRHRWRKESGYIYRLGRARLTFLSGAAGANVVGATASHLLACDEAQDVEIVKWDKEFAPMAASANATRVFWGTAWTAETLLGRELRAAQAAERQDGLRRVFRIDAGQVAAEVPAYGRFVAEQVSRLGRQHPLIRTQYYSEELEAAGGLFPPARLALMRGAHPAQVAPLPGRMYAVTIDVGGEEMPGGERAPGGEAPLSNCVGEGRGNEVHDATALTVFEVDLEGMDGPLAGQGRPLYRAVWRCAWNGASQVQLYAQIKALLAHWQPLNTVIDATGLGAGLAAFLEALQMGRVLRFVFNAHSKSKLGWDFLSIIETGRYKEHAPDEVQPLQALFWAQAAGCEYRLQPTVGCTASEARLLGWGVPPGKRHPASGSPLHDDLLVSAALVAALEDLPWGRAHSAIIPAPAPGWDRF